MAFVNVYFCYLNLISGHEAHLTTCTVTRARDIRSDGVVYLYLASCFVVEVLTIFRPISWWQHRLCIVVFCVSSMFTIPYVVAVTAYHQGCI